MDEKLLYNEDSAFHMTMAIAGLTFSAESEISIINYAVSGSMSNSNQKKCAVAQYYALLAAKKQLEDLDKLDRYKKKLSDLLVKKAVSLAAYHSWEELDVALKMSKSLNQSDKVIFENPAINYFFNRYPKTMFRIRAWYNSLKK